MRLLRQPILLIALVPALSGCVASTVANIVTAPVKVAGKAADMATTSQSEADEKRGREIRRREERMGELERMAARDAAKCRQGDEAACTRASAARTEMRALAPGLPYEPD